MTKTVKVIWIIKYLLMALLGVLLGKESPLFSTVLTIFCALVLAQDIIRDIVKK